MEFRFATAVDDNGKLSGIVKEGNINENGEVNYTKNEEFTDHANFEEIVANEILRRLYGIDISKAKKTLKEEVLNDVRKQRGIPTISEAKQINKPVKQEPVNNSVNDQVKHDSAHTNVKHAPAHTNVKHNDDVKIGVNVKDLTDDEFIEFTKRKVQRNKEFDRFKAIKAKIRSTLEGRSYNDNAFNLFVKLHDIDKRGFFNRTEEDNAVISEAIKLYGAA